MSMNQRSPYGLGVAFEGGRKAKPFRARYFFNGPIDLGRFGSAEEAQRAYDQAVCSINVQHYKATNFPPGTLTALSEGVDDRIRRHLSSLGMESAYVAPAAWLLNQAAASGPAGPAAAAPAPAAPAAAAALAPAPPAAAPAPAPAPETPTWVSGEAQASAQAGVGAAAGNSWPLADTQDGGWGQHNGLMHGLQDADLMMAAEELAAESPAAGMQPLKPLSELDVLRQADMDADNTDFAALLDEIFTDGAPVPGAAGAAFETPGMLHHQQQAPLLLSNSTAGLPAAAVAGWASSSGTAMQQQFQVLGASAGSPPAPAAAGPSSLQATTLQYHTMHRLQGQQWQPPVAGSPMRSPAGHGAASLQQQEAWVGPAASGSGSHAQAVASEQSIAAVELAPAAAVGAGFGAGAFAYAHAPVACGAAIDHHVQQAASIAALQTADELMFFVDVSASHLTQLYRAYAAQASSGQQYVGLSTLTWGIQVRSSQPFPDITRRDEPVVRVGAAVLHLCSTVVAVAAEQSMGPYGCALLQPVVEQLIKALLDLRRLCDAVQAAKGRDSSSGSIMQAWWAQQQPRAGTREGRAALQLLGRLCGAIRP